MGKMKEKFIEEIEKNAAHISFDTRDEHKYIDDEYHYDKSKQVTMEEMIKNHDDWWNSLTEEEKQKIADEAQAASTYFDEQRADRDE